MQDTYLNTLRKERIPVTVIVTNGYHIKQARVVSFDSFVILLEQDGKQTLVFKHAISSIEPQKPIEISLQKGEEQ